MAGEIDNFTGVSDPYEEPRDAEMVVDESGEERVFVHSVDFPASVTEMTVSGEFADLAEQFETAGTLVELKVEVIAIEASGNKTITEENLLEEEE